MVNQILLPVKKILIHSIGFLLTLPAFCQTTQTLEPLGPAVNTKYSEIRPTISADGKILYFVVEGNPKNTKYSQNKEDAQDVWYSEKDSSGGWGTAKQEEAVINSQMQNAVFWVSPDASKILVRGAYSNGKYLGRGVSMSRKTPSGWSQPERLKIRGYDQMSVGKYSGAFMVNDGKTLLLYFSEEKNSEINDIYVSHLMANNEWSQPESIGPTINLEDYDEISPFLAADGITLYFSSDRPGGQGKHDIWMSKRLDSTWKKWSEPVNLPSPINSPKWDAYFTMDAKGEYAYLASSQNAIGGTDLVRIKLDESIMPRPVVIVYGKMINGITMEPVSADVYYDENGNKEKSISTTPVDGKYKMVLPYGSKYTLRVGSDEYMPLTDTLDLSAIGPYKEIYRDVYLNPVSYVKNMQAVEKEREPVRKNIDDIDLDTELVSEGDIINMNNVLFDFAKPILRAASFVQIQKAIRFMKQNPDVRIELSAHTDNIGSPKYNMALSQDRAYAVSQYFFYSGISPNRIVPKGYGESKPVATNKTEAGRQLNRRVEFKILKK